MSPTWQIQDGPGVPHQSVGRKLPHGAILKLVSTNICGWDQHIVRGRTTAPEGLILGRDHWRGRRDRPPCRFIRTGDLVSAPFNISCGRCRNCKERNTGVCLNVNPEAPVARTATSTWAAESAGRPST